jgi:hypothetical protein
VPFWELKVLAQRFNISDKVPGGVVDGAGVGTGVTTATLIEKYDAVVFRVEELGVSFRDVTAWATVEVNN